MLRALDEARFGQPRTLNLRSTLPTAVQAQERVEAWLRERQASLGGDVLIITGRGRGSEGGVAVVRPAVERRLSRLRRQGVVASVSEHSPGSFVVTLAPMTALLGASRRKKDPHPRREPPPPLRGLALSTQQALRELAARSLDALGTPHLDSLMEHEMARHLARLTESIGPGRDRDARLRGAILSALEASLDDR